MYSKIEMIALEFHETVYSYDTFEQFLRDLENDQNLRDKRYGTYFDLLENEIIEEERRIMDLLDSFSKINETLETLIEMKHVFDKSAQLISSNTSLQLNQNFNPQDMIEMKERSDDFSSGLNFVAGVIKAEEDMKMKRMIFRASKGRAVATFFDLGSEDSYKVKEGEKNLIKKKIFTIFFQGGTENILLHKVLKICDLFGASRYNIPRADEITGHLHNIQSEILEKRTFLKEAEMSIKNFLKEKLGQVCI
jgi:V-type H+-transporting ATPase subunit a